MKIRDATKIGISVRNKYAALSFLTSDVKSSRGESDGEGNYCCCSYDATRTPPPNGEGCCDINNQLSTITKEQANVICMILCDRAQLVIDVLHIITNSCVMEYFDNMKAGDYVTM